MKNLTTLEVSPTILPKEFLIDIIGEPRKIIIHLYPIASTTKEIGTLETINPEKLIYTAGHIITHTSKGHIHSNVIISTDFEGRICSLQYRFNGSDTATLNHQDYVLRDLFYKQLAGFDDAKEINHLHFWMMICIVNKLKDTTCLSELHDNEDIERIASTDI